MGVSGNSIIASNLSGIGCKIITCEDGEQVLKRWTWKHDILASSLKGSVEACGFIFNVRLVWHDCVFFSRVFCCMGKRMERAEFFYLFNLFIWPHQLWHMESALHRLSCSSAYGVLVS